MAQAIWADEFARSVPDIEEDEDDELWHVRMSSDDVKVLSLTRLDDLFRLSLVDESTLVWQPGMGNWLPLGQVAGIEADSSPTTVQRKLPAPPAPPRPVAPLAPLDPFGMVSAPKPVPLRPVTQPVAAAFRFDVPESTRPITISEIYPVQQGGGFGRWLLGLAMVAGLAVTLYRNDVVRGAAHSARLDAAYAKLEQALGGPSFGTPRSVEGLTAAAAAAITLPESLPSLSAAAQAASPTPPAAAVQEKAPDAKSAEPSAPAVVSLDSLPVEKATAPAEPEKSVTPSAKASAPSVKAEPVVEKPSGPPSLKDAIRASVSPRSSKPASAPAKKRRGTGGTSDFDPLNGKL
jgi:hypothetical protein